MNRFAQAALTDEELEQISNRFAAACKLLKVDKIEIEHKGPILSCVPDSTLVIRLGDRWLGTVLDWMTIEDAREGKFDKLSRACMVLAKLLHDGGGAPIGGATRYSAVVGELDYVPPEKP